MKKVEKIPIDRVLIYSSTHRMTKGNDSKEILTSNLFHNRLQKIKPHLKTKEGGVIISEQTTTHRGTFLIALLRLLITYFFFPVQSSLL